MALATGYTSYDPFSATRVIFYTRNKDTVLRDDAVLSIFTSSNLDADGGTIYVVASTQESPDIEDATHWHIVEGLDNLQANTMYTIGVRAPTLAFYAVGVGTGAGFIIAESDFTHAVS